MIGTYEIKCHAAKPQMPLPPMFAFKDSPSSLRLLEIPKKIGEWNITTVKVAVNYPDNTTNIYTASRNGNVWVVTFNGCSITGKVANGLEILADGIDENGDAVNGYVLGVGDIYILDRDADIEEAVSKHTMRYCDETPETPAAGDVVIDNGALKIYDGTQWISVDIDLSEYATKSELETAASALDSKIDSTKTELESSIAEVASDIPTYTSELENDSGFITSAQVEPSESVGFAGYAEKSRHSAFVTAIDYSTGKYTDKAILAGELKTNAITGELELDFSSEIVGKYPWTLRELFGTQYSPEINLNWKKASIYRKRIISNRVVWAVVKTNQWMWVADGQFAITTDAAGEPDGNFYVLYYEDETHKNCINDPATDVHQITIENTVGDNIRIATIDGQTGQIDCYSYLRDYPLSIRALAYRDELPTKVSDLTNDAGYLTTVSWNDVQGKPSIPTKTSDLTNDSGFITSSDIPAIPTKTSDLTNDSDFTTNTALNTGLALKQDKLSNAQMSSINSVVDERKTYFTFPNNDVQSAYVEGTLNTYYLQELNPELSHEKILTATEVKIGTAVTGIAYGAFNGCSNLAKVTIPDSVVTIEEEAFAACYALVRLEIPDGVSAINNLFDYTGVQADIVFGKGVQSISQGMFHYVSPNSVTFKGKTMAEVQAMTDYPWDIEDTSIIKTENNATQEWVLEQIAALRAELQGGN